MDKHVYTFRWIIENATYCFHKKNRSLHSPIFVVNGLNNSKWRLCIFPRGDRYAPNFCPIYLKREDCEDGPEFIKLSFELLYPSKDDAKAKSYKVEDILIGRYDGYGVRKGMSQDFLFQQETIVLICKVYTKEPSSEIEYSLATTRISKQRYSFSWEVQDFCNFTPSRNEVYHIKSASSGRKDLSLYFHLMNVLGCEENLCLVAESDDAKIRIQDIKTCLVGNTGEKLNCNQDERAFCVIGKQYMFPLGFSKLQILEKEDEYLSDGTLKLMCELAYSTGMVSEDIIYLGDQTMQESNFFGDCFSERKKDIDSSLIGLESLFMEEKMCDVKLRTETALLPCHKLVLSAASPVFRCMFTHPMKEKDSEIVDILDVEGAILNQMLLFLYTGTLDLSWQSATKLFAVADKYQMIHLKDKCVSYIKAYTSDENAIESLILADFYQDYSLKRAIQKYILNRGKIIFNSKDWRNFMKANVYLAAETMHLKWINA